MIGYVVAFFLGTLFAFALFLLLYAHGEREAKARVAETSDEDPRPRTSPGIEGATDEDVRLAVEEVEA